MLTPANPTYQVATKPLILNQLLVADVEAYASNFIRPKYAVGMVVESPEQNIAQPSSTMLEIVGDPII